MSSNAKTTASLPVVANVASSDRLLVISNANNANAVTASITVANYENHPPQPDPSNSNSLVIQAGVFFFSNGYLYFSDSANHVKRVALSSF